MRASRPWQDPDGSGCGVEKFRLVACLLLIGVAVLAACGGGAGADRPSIILIVIDTLRPDHLGTYGYLRPTSPAIDARAVDAAVFERAFSSSSWTLPAMGSMFTGQLPTRHGAGIVVDGISELPSREMLDDLIKRPNNSYFGLDQSLPTLAQQLNDAGYATAAIVNNSFLSPAFGISTGFDHYDFSTTRPIERTADVTVDLAIEWLEERDPELPFFLVVHLFDPHLPYAAPPPFQGRFAAEFLEPEETQPIRDTMPLRRLVRGRRPKQRARAGALLQAIYDEEIAFTDHELDRFFTALDAAGLWGDSIVALTSDHGEEFFDHRRFEHGHTMFNELLLVPLIVWGPGIRPGRHEAPVSLVDLFPTLLEATGLSAATDVAGVSLWPLLTGGPQPPDASPIPFDRLLIAERTLYGDEKKAAITWPWKVWVNVDNDYSELYQIESDPGETTNVRDDHRDLYYTILTQLQETMVAADTEGRANAVTLDEATLEHLRALGYIR